MLSNCVKVIRNWAEMSETLQPLCNEDVKEESVHHRSTGPSEGLSSDLRWKITSNALNTNIRRLKLCVLCAMRAKYSAATQTVTNSLCPVLNYTPVAGTEMVHDFSGNILFSTNECLEL